MPRRFNYSQRNYGNYWVPYQVMVAIYGDRESRNISDLSNDIVPCAPNFHQVLNSNETADSIFKWIECNITGKWYWDEFPKDSNIITKIWIIEQPDLLAFTLVWADQFKKGRYGYF